MQKETMPSKDKRMEELEKMAAGEPGELYQFSEKFMSWWTEFLQEIKERERSKDNGKH